MRNLLKPMMTVLAFWGPSVFAQDACSTSAIHTFADVTIVGGRLYQVEALYRSKDQAASLFIQEENSRHVVEGPFAWAEDKNGTTLGDTFQRDFGLGHQFHAFILRFDEVVHDITSVQNIAFAGKTYDARRGVLDTGGIVYLIDAEADQPAGLRFVFGETTIDITLADWREQEGTPIPYALTIDDGTRIFEYRYQYVDTTPKPLMWFYDRVPAPDIDAVGIYRLHRKQLIAHCLGDADMLAATLAPDVVMANGGQVFSTSPSATRDVFKGVFARRKYDTYIDLKYPHIEAASSGDLGWATVHLQTDGTNMQTSASFHEKWAWTMNVRKIDGQWLMVGNASNRAP